MLDWTTDKRVMHCLQAVSDYCYAKGIYGFPNVCDGVGEIVMRYFATEQNRMEAKRYRNALETALLLLEHGDFTNGVTDGTGTIDEGRKRAEEMIVEIRAILASAWREE